MVKRTLQNERGAVLVITAICAFLIVMLAISFSIDLPTTQSASLKAQHALDIGAVHGLYALPQYESSASAARGNAEQIMTNAYGPGSFGTYSNDLSGNADFRIAIPSYNPVSGDPYYAEGAPFLAKNTRIFNDVFDPVPINDFKNGIYLYSKFKPLQYFRAPGISSDAEVEVASVAMIQTTLSYVLVDPAFSMDQTNYNFMFGETEGSTNNMWSIGAIGYQDPGWTWPNNPGLFYNRPDGTDYNAATWPLTEREKVYHFYAAACDSLPWAYYKSAVVDLIDMFSSSSAFNYTTYVGLTGYSALRAVVAIHPVGTDLSANIMGHPYSQSSPPGSTEFPLQTASDAFNRGLHLPKPRAFGGYVNTFNPDKHANNSFATGINDWSLHYCAAIYRETKAARVHMR